MKELMQFEYIKYVSSHSAVEGSKVYLYVFDTTAIQPVIQDSIISDTTTDTNTLLYKRTKQNKQREKLAPTQEEVFDFFKSKNCAEAEASKFFHHYQSNGWLVGGRTPMKNWQAAAEKWLLNSTTFHKHEPKPGNHIATNKDYSEPL
jgi:hypothetical protein